jgi:hypothetical protein
MRVWIDDRPFDVLATFYPSHDQLPATPTASGTQILAAVGRDIAYQLWCEGEDRALDVSVGVTEPFLLKDGQRFYCCPPCHV